MLYAVHYAWVEGHAAKAPVGIWAEGGVRYYPEQWSEHDEDGSQAEMESTGKEWTAWVAMRSEFGSTYGASWRAVESDRPMAEVLEALQTAFFAEEHPVRRIFVSAPEGSGGNALSDTDTGVPEQLPPPPWPAERFVVAQAWWLASELCRRSSRLRILETWPMDGFYHGLEVGDPGAERHVFMNFRGRIHLQVGAEAPEPVSWFEVLAADSPHGVVHRLEEVMAWSQDSADATTPRSLTYCTLARVLHLMLNDRARWTVADGWTASGADDWSDPDLAFLDRFEDARSVIHPDGPEAALPRMWVVRRDGDDVALLTDGGRLHRRGLPPVELMPVYRRGRDLDDVVTVVMQAAM